jgi:hypothetical protein
MAQLIPAVLAAHTAVAVAVHGGMVVLPLAVALAGRALCVLFIPAVHVRSPLQTQAIYKLVVI